MCIRDSHRDHRDQHDGDQDGLDVVPDERDLPQEVAEHGDPAAPQHAADQVEDHEAAVVHPAHPGDDRGEGAHDRHEAGQHDRLRSVSLEEGGGLLDVLLLEDPGVGAAEEARPDLAAEEVADLVPRHRGGHDQCADQPERLVQVGAVGHQQAGGEQQRVTGQEEADQQAGLGEDDGQDAEQAEGGDQGGRIEPGRAEGEAGHGAGTPGGRVLAMKW